MMRALLESAAHPGFAMIALFFLVSFYFAIVWWTYRVVPKSVHDDHALIPLRDESATPPAKEKVISQTLNKLETSL